MQQLSFNPHKFLLDIFKYNFILQSNMKTHLVIFLLIIITISGCAQQNIQGDKVTQNITNCINESFSAEALSIKPIELQNPPKYTIALSNRQFVPLQNNNEALKCFQDLPNGKSYYVLVQLYHSLNESDKNLLKSYGINLFGYIPTNSWQGSFSKPLKESDVERLSKLIRWVGVILPEDKVPEYVLEGRDIYGRELLISFFDDVTEDEAKNLIHKYRGKLISKSFITGHRLRADIDKNLIKQLADENIIKYIEGPVTPPKTTR